MTVGLYVTLPTSTVQPDALGLWQAECDFTLSSRDAGRAERTILWQIVLPSDPFVALAHLAKTEQRLSATLAALPDADRRLRNLVASCLPRAESFAAGSINIRQPERELGLLLQGVEMLISFGNEGNAWGMGKLADEACAFVRQVRETLRYSAQVETIQDRVVVAHTNIGWLGHATVLSRDSLHENQIGFHRRALELALRSRLCWVRLAAQTALGITLLSTGLVTANPVLAAGGVWRFIKAVLSEWQPQDTGMGSPAI